MPTITIDGTDFDAYATVATADDYMVAAYHGATWRAALADDKARSLVTATRLLDRQVWQGRKASDAQALDWPRSGIAGVDDSAVPQAVVDATCELALSILDGSSVQTNATTEEQAKRLKAGSVEIENFRLSSSTDGAPRFPQIVHELVGQWLASSAPLTATSAGTDATALSTDYGFTWP